MLFLLKLVFGEIGIYFKTHDARKSFDKRALAPGDFMKIILMGFLMMGSISAFAEQVNVKVIKCRNGNQYEPICREVSNEKAADLLQQKGYFTVSQPSQRTIKITLDNGCRLIDQCQDMKPRATLEVIDNESNKSELKLNATGVWPLNGSSVLDDVINQL